MVAWKILIALIIGSCLSPLLIRCIYRMPDDQKLWTPPLQCPHCQTPFPFVAHLPIVGFFLYRKHCWTCQKGLSYQPLLIEITTIFGGVFIFLWNHDPASIVIDLIFLYVLLIISFIDWNHMIIEPRVVVAGLSIRLLWIALFDQSRLPYFLGSMCIAAGAFYFLGFIYETIRRRQGLGEGDAAVVGIIGLWGGWEMLSIAVLIAAVSGLLVGGAFLLIQKQTLMTSRIPFAPFLCLGGGVVYFINW